MDFNRDLLKNLTDQIGISLETKELDDFAFFYDLLIEKNKVMNLTAITEMDEVILKHFVDSLILLHFYHVDDSMRIADLGTGAGFPGIPLKIARPNQPMVLMDSLQKRLNFLGEVKEKLKFDQLDLVHGRAEDLGRDKNHRESYDLVVSRAVANLSTLSEYCLPLVKEGGAFISYKAGNLEEELSASKKAIALLGGDVPEVISYKLPTTDMDRNLVIIKKIKKTPKQYPRKAGTPSKEPLS